jgi:hypothetical protein
MTLIKKIDVPGHFAARRAKRRLERNLARPTNATAFGGVESANAEERSGSQSSSSGQPRPPFTPHSGTN